MYSFSHRKCFSRGAACCVACSVPGAELCACVSHRISIVDGCLGAYSTWRSSVSHLHCMFARELLSARVPAMLSALQVIFQQGLGAVFALQRAEKSFTLICWLINDTEIPGNPNSTLSVLYVLWLRGEHSVTSLYFLVAPLSL